MLNTTQNTSTKDMTVAEVKSFQNEITELRNTASGWYGNQYKSSNEALYSIFSKLYVLYDNLTTTTDEATTQKREWIEAECKAKGVVLTKKPTILQLLVNYAFYVADVDCSKRLSSYVRVLKAAVCTDGIAADNIANWIADNGGIESIRQQTTKSAVTKEMRIEEGISLVNRFKTLSTFSNSKTQQYASTKTDEVVLLVGVLQADGTIAVKHTIFKEEDNSNIKGSTAINTALCNVYSKHNETIKNDASKKEAEDKAQSMNDIIANAELADEVQLSEAA
jgi:hypothetical protein